MNKLPLYFGYAGAVPFVLFMLLTLLMDKPEHFQILSFIQLAYGAMILSFLGGVHWGQAIPGNNKQQMSFAMVPTVACFALIIWTFVVDPVLPLFAMAGLFWVVFAADKRLMPLDFIPEGYFKFRRNLTIIVSVTLVISGLVSL